jgi:hypothetical protein
MSHERNKVQSENFYFQNLSNIIDHYYSMKKIIFTILLSIAGILGSGQNNFYGTFTNSDFYLDCPGYSSFNETFYLYKDSSFLYDSYTCYTDAIIRSYSHGRYVINDSIIEFKSLEYDPYVKVDDQDKYLIKHKNGNNLIIAEYRRSNISRMKLEIKNGILRRKSGFGHLRFFMNTDKKVQKKISTRIDLPIIIKDFFSDSVAFHPDEFSVFQKIENVTHHLGDIQSNDSITVWDVDSSLFIIKSKYYPSYFTCDTLIYTNKNLNVVLKYNNHKPPTLNQHRPPCSKIAYASVSRLIWGIDERAYVLKKDKLSHKKCSKMLSKSDFFKNNRISYTDSFDISLNNDQLFLMMNKFGSNYMSEMLNDNLSSENFLKKKNNPDLRVSKPAFSNNKIYAVIRVLNTTHNSDKHYIFERRMFDYELIGILTDKIEKVNYAMFVRI